MSAARGSSHCDAFVENGCDDCFVFVSPWASLRIPAPAPPPSLPSPTEDSTEVRRSLRALKAALPSSFTSDTERSLARFALGLGRILTQRALRAFLRIVRRFTRTGHAITGFTGGGGAFLAPYVANVVPSSQHPFSPSSPPLAAESLAASLLTLHQRDSRR